MVDDDVWFCIGYHGIAAIDSDRARCSWFLRTRDRAGDARTCALWSCVYRTSYSFGAEIRTFLNLCSLLTYFFRCRVIVPVDVLLWEVSLLFLSNYRYRMYGIYGLWIYRTDTRCSNCSIIYIVGFNGVNVWIVYCHELAGKISLSGLILIFICRLESQRSRRSRNSCII